jgi:hypothetical protein
MFFVLLPLDHEPIAHLLTDDLDEDNPLEWIYIIQYPIITET